MNLRRAVAAAVALLAISAPGAASAADEAASVNGESISIDDFEAAVEESGAVDDATETADAVVARTTLSDLIADAARVQFLRTYGMDADATNADDQLARLRAPDVSELGDLYDARPASLGVICTRFIPVADESAGEAAKAELNGGADYADVAATYSADPSVLEADGWVTLDPESPCVPLSDLQFESAFANAIVAARPGEAVGPVAVATGNGQLHVVLVIAPLDEVADAIEAFYAGAEEAGTSAGELLFRGWFLDADVTVNPRYGRWDPASSSIVPLGQE